MAAELLLDSAEFKKMIDRTVLRLMIGLGVPLASALLIEQLPKTGVAEVPFAFQVEEQTLPPGTYSVKQADTGRGIRIQNQKVPEAGTKCVAAKRKFGKAEGARLVFDRCGGHYFLSEIWFDSDGRGLILPESRLEQEATSNPQDREVQYIRFQ